MKFKVILLTCIGLFMQRTCFAQTADDNKIEYTGIYGFSAFTPEKFTLPGHVYGAEIAYDFNMADYTADFIRALNIKSIDIAASYRSFHEVTIDPLPGYKGELGGTYALLTRAEFGILHAGNVQLLFTPAVGLAYATQTYFTNQNPLVGSHINFAAQGGLRLFVPVTDNIGVKAGIDVFHYSNVAYQTPNFGINSFNGFLGLVKTLSYHQYAHKEAALFNYGNDPAFDEKNAYEFGADIGGRGVFEQKRQLYKSGFFASYNRRLSSVFSLKAEYDAVYYYTDYDPTNNQTFQEYGTSYDRWRTGLSVGADMFLGNFVVFANVGYYLHFNSFYNVKWYWTPGVKYYVLPWMAVQAKAYIHYTDADILGVGLVFRVH